MAEYKREANTLYPSQGSSLSAYDNAGFEVISYCEKENIYGPFSRIMKANKYEQRKDITDVEGAKFADQFEHLREKDKKSFVAVIHVDGNRLGQKISNALRNKRNLKEEMLQFCCSSLQIDKLFKETLDETIRINFRNELAKGESLPFRPIVRDGDDITLIVKADRAFAFIQVYMEQLAEKQVSKEYIHLKENIGNISATAGAVFVRDTFPFDEAYDLAEQLCKAGKAKLADEGRDVSCMDYHILREGLTGSVREYRQAHYQIAGGQLHIRPYLFTDSGEDSYDSFLHLRNALTASEIARNKLKALRNAYSESVQEAEYTYRTILSRHKNGIDHQKNAFVDKNGKKRAVFFDVLDVMDI
ncbi:Cas10/Cmr2 second palm domain-containing protein [Bacteroides heparinolyticus]|uniref:Cas10/Cmr2 second palm domain-containing protein n=1 Tax=Prevotella heparinolytica TaxID=28113 RepID=UPI0035A0EF9A